MKNPKPLNAQGLRDAAWVESFGEGTEFVTGAFRPNREAELIAHGVLVPVEGRPGHFTVGKRRQAQARTARRTHGQA